MSAGLFLKRLYARLKWQVPLEEAQDIIRDYREIFEEGRGGGKTDAEICAGLGSPREVVGAILAEREQKSRLPFYLPLLILSVTAALFYPATIVWYGLYWDFRNWVESIIVYVSLNEVFAFLAPMPALLLYALRHKRGYQQQKYRYHTRFFYSALIAPCSMTAVASIKAYQFFTHLLELSREAFMSLVTLIELTNWIIAAAWLFSIYLSDKIGRFSLSLYFLYAAMHITLAGYIDVLAHMNFEELWAPADFLVQIYVPIAYFGGASTIGIILWCAYCFVIGRKRGDSNG
jgi:hypothetical protein